MLRGDRLKLLRINRGYTYQQLAEQLDLGTKQVWRYETGENDPTAEVLGRIAKEFNVSADYLLGLTDEPTPCLNQSDLEDKEREVISAWRRGDRIVAIKTIVLDD